jgi:hypothetical protein
MKYSWLLFVAVAACGGCGLPFSDLIPPSDEELREETSTTLHTFLDLLNQGWELRVNDEDRLILVKRANGQLLVKDLFGELRK